MTSQGKLFEFFYILLQKRKVTASEIAAYFGVTSRTVYRWCDSLAFAGIPLYTAQGKGGGIMLTETYSLDSAVFSDDEKKAMLSSLTAISSLSEGDVESYRNAAKKISSLVKSASDWIRIDFEPWNEDSGERSNIFNTVRNAILGSNVISFDYYAAEKNMTERIVQPWKIIFKGQAWYLFGFCNEKKAPRYFKLSRIKNINLLPEKNTVSYCPEFEKNHETFFESQHELNRVCVRCSVKNFILSMLLDDISSVKILEKGECESVVEFLFPDAPWNVSYFLHYGSALKILEPKSLKENFVNELLKIKENYDS